VPTTNRAAAAILARFPSDRSFIPRKNRAFVGSYFEIFMHMQVRPAYEPVMSVFIPLLRALD
jgi:hypothetical protein